MKRRHATDSRDEAAPWRLDAAATFEGTTRVAAIGWRIVPPEGEPAIGAKALRSGRSLVFAELQAVSAGLREARRLGARRLVISIPGALAARLLGGGSPGRARRAGRAANRVRALFSDFAEVRVARLRGVDPELARQIGEALDVALHAAAERADRRSQIMEQVLARAKEVRLERMEDGWIANGRYRVSLDPLGCECPAWTRRWSGAPIAGRRAQRLLCKHLVALAVSQGIRTPEELAELARRAPS